MSRILFVGSCRSRGGFSANEKEGKFQSNDSDELLVVFNLSIGVQVNIFVTIFFSMAEALIIIAWFSTAYLQR